MRRGAMVKKSRADQGAGGKKPSFIHLEPVAVAYGTRGVVISGRLYGPEDGVPGGKVMITLPDTAPRHVDLDAQGCFRMVADTSGLSAGAHPVTCEYAGDGDFAAKIEKTKITVTAASDAATSAAQDLPLIVGTILDENDKPVAGLEMVIYDHSATTVLGYATTNDQGMLSWIAPHKGVYYVGPKANGAHKTQVVVRSLAQFELRLSKAFADVATRGQAPSPANIVPAKDFSAYPLLTEEVGYPPSPVSRPSGGGPQPRGAALGDMATKAIGDVLGWKPNTSDAKGFVGALTQAFTLTDVEGHVQATWVPRSYVVQTDLAGGITGAQASLLSRAKESVDQCLPLLDGLYALDANSDPEYVTALRELARNQMNEIVKQLAEVGGPSVLRVDTYFKILLWGPAPLPSPVTVPTDADLLNPQSTLGSLRDEAGIQFAGNPFSNSVEDEQDITNFRIIVDYMISLWQSWLNNRKFFLLGASTPAFFGTQLVLISRQFSVIVETVNEVRFVLDSVFIGPSERQTLLLQFSDPNSPPMFLEDVLQEIEDLSTDEGPRLVRDGGRLSVNNNLLPVVRMLHHLIRQIQPPQKITNLGQLPDGLRTVRVGNAFDDLSDQLRALIGLIEQVGRDLPPQPNEFLVVTPSSIDFGLVSGTRNVTVTVVNNTSQDLANASVSVASHNNAFTAPMWDPGTTLHPNTPVKVMVTFAPARKGPQTGTLTITAGGQSIVVPLTGIGQ